MTKSSVPDWLQLSAERQAQDAFLDWCSSDDQTSFTERKLAIMASARAAWTDREYRRWEAIFANRLADLIKAATGEISSERERCAQIAATYLDHPNLAGNDLALHIIAEIVAAIRQGA
jgi:hypothetical protein